MIDLAFVQCMARYNRWQNENLYGVAEDFPDEERKRERGAFFGSIHKTLNHLLWADQAWMSRFSNAPPPQGGILQSVSLYSDWDALRRERKAFDETILAWADRLDASWLTGDLTWFSGRGKTRNRQTKMACRHPYVQSPNAPSRTGALLADAGRRKAARHGFVAHAGVTRSTPVSVIADHR
jgi:uncharacterized damage-inducible protein DinB